MAAVPLLFWAVLFAYPMLAIVGRGLVPEGHLALGAVLEVLAQPATRAVLWFTLWQAAVSTLLTLALGLPAAYTVARHEFRGRALFQAVLTSAFVMPTIVVAVAFRATLAPLGLGSGLPAILLAHCFFNYVVVVRTVGAVWANLDPSLPDAARTLGATRWQAFRKVTLPLLTPAIVSAGVIVFVFTFTSFGIVLLLGGSRYATVEVEIWRRWTQALDPTAAIGLALCQMAAIAAVVAVSLGFARRRSRSLPLRDRAGGLSGRGWSPVVVANVAVGTLLVGVPLVVLVARAFGAGGGSLLTHWVALVRNPQQGVLTVAPLRAVLNSVTIAVVATAVALIVGGCAAVVVARHDRDRDRRRGPGTRVGRLLDVALLLPLAASAVTIALGFLVAFDRPPLDLRTSPLLIPLAHALVAVPFVVRLVAPKLGGIDVRLHEAATTLGASARQRWQAVDLPIVWRALLVAAGFAFCISLGEFGATLLLARPGVPTVPVAIERLLSRPGSANLGQAMALSVVLMVITVVVVLSLERVRAGRLGEL